MPELNIEQLAFTYTSYGPLANQKDPIQHFTRNERFQLYLLLREIN